MGMIRWLYRCAQGLCPCYAIYFWLFHHCTQLIHVKQVSDGGDGGRDGGGQRNGKIVFHQSLFIQKPVLTESTCCFLLCIQVCASLRRGAYCFWPSLTSLLFLTPAARGLSALLRATLTTLITAENSLLAASCLSPPNPFGFLFF